MSFFSELGAGLRAVTKDYQEIKQEFVSLGTEISDSVKDTKKDAEDIAKEVQQGLHDTTKAAAGLVKPTTPDPTPTPTDGTTSH